MPRNMSFALTTAQIRDRSKTVTRRKGWRHARLGDVINAVEKVMGFKPGEKMKRICQIRITSITTEPLNHITHEDVVREGFPGMTAEEFVAMFCRNMGGQPDQIVTRIEFEYLEN